MKKIALRIFAITIVATLLVTMLAGCRRDTDSLYEAPEFVFLPEYIELPDVITDVSNLIHSDDKLFFSVQQVSDEDAWESESKLFSMNIDGTEFTELPNFIQSSPPSGEEDALSNVHIISLNIDSDGNLWIAEYGELFCFDLPDDFDGEEWEKWNYHRQLDASLYLRKLDSTGAELSSLDLQSLPGLDTSRINTFNIDSDDNLYIGINMDITVLSSEGNLLFRLESQNWANELIRMADGSIASYEWGETGRSLRKIDTAAGAWGETVTVPIQVNQVFPGNEDFSLFFLDASGLFGLDPESGESVMLLNWTESNITIGYLHHVSVLPDGRFLCINKSWGNRTGEPKTELIILTRTPYSDMPERTVLTLATASFSGDLRSQVIEFNKTNLKYRIHVIDYSQFNTNDDRRAGLTRLTTDIIAGNVPDILDVSNLPFTQYAARGLFEDLYPFIDADPELDRGDFNESVFLADEMNGELYRVFPSFFVQTMVGNPTVVGAVNGWNMDEFLAVLDANPQADVPIGQWLTRGSFLWEAVTLGIDEYVDWAAGEVYFDTGSFEQLLELAGRFPAEIDFDSGGMMREWVEESELIAQGRQIMSSVLLFDIEWILYYHHLYGDEIVFKGFPTENRNGNYLHSDFGLAMTTSAIDKDGAWEFLRINLTYEWQRDNIYFGIPTNKAAFDAMLEVVMTAHEEGSRTWWMNDTLMEIKPLTRTQADQVIALIDSVGGTASSDDALMNIITEGANDFFDGRTTAHDAARIIQSRASILVSERS